MASKAAQSSSAVVAERLAAKQEEQPNSAVAQVAASVAANALAQGTTAAVVAPPAAAVAAATKTILDAADHLFRSRRHAFLLFIVGAAEKQMPGAPRVRINELAAAEMAREAEFQRKARARLERDLPSALAEPDPGKRAEAVAKILEREKRYMAQREQAAAQRLVYALEADLLKQASPQGAYWQLSPLVREHCLECLAFAGKFWPWAVLDTLHLPRHPNCACRLLALDEAISAGLMSPGDVPDEHDSIELAKTLLGEVGRVREALTDEQQHQLAERMQLAVRSAALEKPKPIEEAIYDPSLHPRDRHGRWRNKGLLRALSKAEWAAHSERVTGPLYHYSLGERVRSREGHGALPMQRFPEYLGRHEKELEAHGDLHIFNVKDSSAEPERIWLGLGSDDAFNRLISQTASERGMPEVAGLGYRPDGPMPFSQYTFGLQAGVVDKLKTQGYDGISIGGEVLVWNTEKLRRRDDLRNNELLPGQAGPYSDPGPNTVVSAQLEARLDALGVHTSENLDRVPQRVVDDTLLAISKVRSQIKPTKKAPDPLAIDLLEARDVNDGAVLSTYYDDQDGAIILEFNLHEPEQLWLEDSQAAALDFVGWAGRDAYGRALHEMGHVYQRNQTGRDLQPVLKALEDAKMVKGDGKGNYEAEVPEQGRRTPGWPSIYAQAKPPEAFAEMFALLMRPDALRKYPDHELLDEHLRLFRESWNRQMKAKGLATIPEVIPA